MFLCYYAVNYIHHRICLIKYITVIEAVTLTLPITKTQANLIFSLFILNHKFIYEGKKICICWNNKSISQDYTSFGSNRSLPCSHHITYPSFLPPLCFTGKINQGAGYFTMDSTPDQTWQVPVYLGDEVSPHTHTLDYYIA